MDHLGAISLFNKVVETGSFSEAGRQCNLAPSSVSRRIVDLENWVGAALFHRTTRRINLTEVGRLFHERTADILLDLEEARILAAGLEDKPSGLVRMTLPASIEQHFVAAVTKFQSIWPNVSFGLTSTDRKVDLISEGYDLAIRVGKLTDSTLKARKFAEVRRRLCASPDYLKKSLPIHHPTDLADHNCITFRRTPGYNVWQFKDRNNKAIDVRASGDLSANSGNMIVSAACRGRGVILSPEWLLGKTLERGELVELLPGFDPSPTTTPLYAVHPYQRFVPPKVRVFVDFLKDHFSSDYNWCQIPD